MIFFVCSLALFMASVDATIVATALPRIGDALHTRVNWTGWTITIYQLGQMIAMPLAGKISDQFGRKRIFILCIVIFTVSSLACGLSTSIYMLIPLRLIQALGGGTFMPSASGIIADHFGRDRDRGIGMFTTVAPIGSIVGPVFGGVIAQYWIWRGIFFINVPIGIVLVALAIHYIPQAAPRDSGRLDLRGVALLSMTIVTGMLTVTTLGEHGASFTDPEFLAPMLAALIFGWRFARHTKQSTAPFIPMRLISGQGFLTMNFLNFFFGSAVFGFATLAPLYAENRYHIAITEAGTIQSPRAIGSIFVAAAATMLLRRIGYRLPMAIGFAVVAVGLIMLSIAPRGIGPYWWLSLFSGVTGIGLGSAAPATNNATLQLAPDQVAAIVGLRGMFRQCGGIVYVAMSTTILARSLHPGIVQAHIFLYQSVVLFVMIGLVYLIPDHRGTW